MNSSQRQTLEIARRVQEFLDVYGARLTVTIPASLRARLDLTARHLAEQEAEQAQATMLARAETVKVAEYRREAYIRFLRPIGVIATIASGKSGRARPLVMQAESLSQRDFLERAARVAKIAESDSTVFVAHGMPSDFAEQLRLMLAQIRAAQEAHRRHKSRQVAATASIKVSVKSAREIIRLVEVLLAPVLNEAG